MKVACTELHLIYLEIVLSIKRRNQKHGGFDVTISLLSWGNPLTTAQVWPGAFVHSIEIIDIECVLLSFFSENFVSTKWRIYKGIFGSSRLLREGVSRGREECDCFFCQTKFTKRYKFEILNGKMIYKRF